MKHWILLVFITLLLCGSVNVACAEKQEFEIVNSSDSDLYVLEIRPSNADTWGPNVLTKDSPLKDGKKITIAFSNYDANVEYWDILARNCCNEELVWHKLRLNSIHTIILHDDDKVELN